MSFSSQPAPATLHSRHFLTEGWPLSTSPFNLFMSLLFSWLFRFPPLPTDHKPSSRFRHFPVFCYLVLGQGHTTRWLRLIASLMPFFPDVQDFFYHHLLKDELNSLPGFWAWRSARFQIIHQEVKTRESLQHWREIFQKWGQDLSQFISLQILSHTLDTTLFPQRHVCSLQRPKSSWSPLWLYWSL